MTTSKKTSAAAALERLTGGPLSLRGMLVAIREGEEWSQAEMARTLGVSRSHLCDIEKGRKSVSAGRAAEFAGKLGYSREQFVRLALQDLVTDAGLSMLVKVQAA